MEEARRLGRAVLRLCPGGDLFVRREIDEPLGAHLVFNLLRHDHSTQVTVAQAMYRDSAIDVAQLMAEKLLTEVS